MSGDAKSAASLTSEVGAKAAKSDTGQPPEEIRAKEAIFATGG
jgi:hypothetical protein